MLLLLLHSSSFAQVAISREGYPYCEPFIGGINDIRRPYVTLFGDGNGPGDLASALTGQSIRLTENEQYKDGYVYLDLPFSPEYGIQVSFEYLSYGGDGADGIVFFMFDGEYGDLPPSLPFNIGGFGGSLGYAPRIEGATTHPGLSGAYIGVALDEWGNFISLESSPPNKPNGLGPNPKLPGYMRYPHTVGVRGPESNDYRVFDYAEVNIAPRPIADQFPIDTGPFPGLTCANPEYRKVYVNLSPRPDVGYDLTVQMRVGDAVYNVIGPTHYNFDAPENIKLGFSAATGENKNFHEIRNLAVDVSKVEEAQRPVASDEFYRTCVNEELEIFIDVDLQSSDKAFIRCIQLYEDGLDIDNPTAPWNTFSSDIDHTQCGLTPICVSCNSDLSPISTSLGEFVAIIEDLDDGNFEDLRDRVEVIFTPNTGATGRSKIYYTVTDNFGLTSKPKELVVVINPIPEFLDEPLIELPTCDGQNDGKITAEVGNLVQGFDHYWLYTNKAGVESNLGKGEVIGEVVNDGDGASFVLDGVNVGQYVLVIRNPLEDGENGYCEDQLAIPLIEDETGTPVTVEEDEFIVCEGESVTISAEVDPIYLNGLTPKFLWYKDAAKTQPILSNPSVPAADGFTYEVTPDGNLIVDGLVSQAGDPFTYNFYVEVDVDRSGSQNLCSMIGDLEVAASVTVHPAVTFDTPIILDDWCMGNMGSINITFRRGNQILTEYRLFDSNGDEFRPVQPTGLFEGLPKGNYTVVGTSQDPDCLQQYEFEVLGPENTLAIELVNSIDPTCELDNGLVSWQVAGGNGGYEFVSISGYPDSSAPIVNKVGEDIFEINGLISVLNPYTLTLTVRDSQGCEISSTQLITPQILPEYSLTAIEICLNESHIFIPSMDNPGTPDAAPVFRWYKDQNATEADEILSGEDTDLGMTFAVDASTGQLTVSEITDSGTYTFYLRPDLLNDCLLEPLPVTLVVNPLPVVEIVRSQSASCFGGDDGLIEVNVTNGNITEFEFLLEGEEINTGYQSSPIFDSGITEGNYTIHVRNTGTGCESTIEEILADPEELVFTILDSTDPSCNLDNGTILFQVSGGTPVDDGGYTITINGDELAAFDISETTPNTFLVENLPEGNYTILIEDQNSCPAQDSRDLVAQILPVYSMTDEEICLNESHSFIPSIDNPGTPDASPIFRWYKDENAADTNEILSGEDTDLGMTFTVDASTGQLTVSEITDAGTYTFYLRPDIFNECPLDPVPVVLTVNPIPEVDFDPVSPLCFDESSGSLNLTSGGSVDYTYSLVGNPASFNTATGSFEGLAAGTYTIVIRNEVTDCSVEIERTIDSTPELLIAELSSSDPTCGAPNGEISFEVSGGNPGYDITINGDPLSNFSFIETGSVYTVSNLGPDTYDINVVDENGCAKSLPTIILTNNDGIEIDVAPSELDICEGATAVLRPDIDAPAGTPIRIRWYKNADYTNEILDGAQDGQESFTILQDYSLSIEGLSSGNFTYYARVGGDNICIKDSESSVIVLDKIAAVLDPSPIVCFGDSNGHLMIGNVTGGSGKFEYSIDGASWQSDPLFEGLSAGDYSLSVRDTNGLNSCFFTEDFTIEGPAGAIEMAPNVPIPSSCGENNGEIMNVVISGGWGDYTHQWTKDSPTGTAITGPITGIKDLAPGMYYLTVADTEGCEAIFDFEIEIAPDPVYAINSVADACFGEQISLEAVHTPGDLNDPVARTNVVWYKGPDQSGLISDGVDPTNSNINYTIVVDPANWVNSTLKIDGLPAGVYTYYLFVECTQEEIPVTFEVFDFPVLTFTGVKESCYQAGDGKIIIDGTVEPGMLFEISNITYDETELAAADFSPGMYTVNAQGAVCTQSFTVTIDPALELSGDLVDSKDAACGLTDGYLSFEWNGGQPPYLLTLTQSDGAELTHTTSDAAYTFDNLGQGNYSFTITDDEGCVFNLGNPVTVQDGPTEIIVDQLYSSCDGKPISISPQVNPANSNAVFTWYKGTVSAANEISDGEVIDGVTFILNARGDLDMTGTTVDNAPFELMVTVAGDGLCPGDEKKVGIGVFGNPQVQVNPINELCFGEGGSLKLEVPGGQLLEFSLNGGAYQAYPNDIIDGLAPGSYKLEARNPNGCVVEVGNYAVSGPSAPLELQATAIGASCLSPNGMIIGTILGGTAPYNVKAVGVSGEVPVVLEGNRFTIENQPLGNYELSVTDANQCEDTEPALTITNDPLQVAVDDISICEGEAAVLTPRVLGGQGAGLAYSWFKDRQGLEIVPVGTSTDGDLIYEVDASGVLTITGLSLSDSPITYYAELDINRPCSRELAPAVVTVQTIPNLKTRNPSLVCDPTQTVDLSLYIDGFDPDTYDYEIFDKNDNQMRMEDIRQVSETGTYKVRMKNKNSNCYTATDRILVRIADVELVAEFEYEVEVVAGQPVANQQVGIGDEVQFLDRSIGNPVRWEWDFGDGATSTEANPIHVFAEIRTYLVILTTWDEMGCESSTVLEIEITDNFDIIFPNAFTPDRSDGKNNYFFPKFRGLASLKVYVFTTWGELIYESSSLEDKGWDGTFRNTPAKNGNYVFRGKYTSRGGFEGETSGVFILIR